MRNRAVTIKDLTNTARAFATVKQSDEKLFTALARAAVRRVAEFNARDLTNTARAFVTVKQSEFQ